MTSWSILQSRVSSSTEVVFFFFSIVVIRVCSQLHCVLTLQLTDQNEIEVFQNSSDPSIARCVLVHHLPQFVDLWEIEWVFCQKMCILYVLLARTLNWGQHARRQVLWLYTSTTWELWWHITVIINLLTPPSDQSKTHHVCLCPLVANIQPPVPVKVFSAATINIDFIAFSCGYLLPDYKFHFPTVWYLHTLCFNRSPSFCSVLSNTHSQFHIGLRIVVTLTYYSLSILLSYLIIMPPIPYFPTISYLIISVLCLPQFPSSHPSSLLSTIRPLCCFFYSPKGSFNFVFVRCFHFCLFSLPKVILSIHATTSIKYI